MPNSTRTIESQQTRLGHLEAVIRAGLAHFVAAGLALLEIRDEKLYVPLGHKSFSSYLRKRWKFSPKHVYRLMQAADVASKMEPEHAPENERQARALADVPEEYREEVMAALGDEATAAAIDEAQAGLAAAASEEDDEEERRQAQKEALERWKETRREEPTHRLQKSRLEKFRGACEQIERYIGAATDTEAASMVKGLGRLLKMASKKAGVPV